MIYTFIDSILLRAQTCDAVTSEKESSGRKRDPGIREFDPDAGTYFSFSPTNEDFERPCSAGKIGYRPS